MVGQDTAVGLDRAFVQAHVARSAPDHLDGWVPVVVLNVGNFPYNQSSVGIARSLGRLGVPVYLIQNEAFNPAGSSRYLTGAFVWRASGTDVAHFLEGMSRIGETIGRRAVLIPTGDLAAILVAENAEALSLWFILPEMPPALPRSVATRWALYQLCERLGVATPQTHRVTSPEEFRDVAERSAFPVLVKGSEPWLLPAGIGTEIVSKPQQLIELGKLLAANGTATSLIVQEIIPKETSQDWFVHAYYDRKGNAARLFTGIKLRSYPAFAGFTTLGRALENQELRAQAAALLSGLQYRGVADLDYRFDGRDGSYKLLDFNPRIGAQFRLFEDESGIDVARALYIDLTGGDLPSDARQVEGRTFVSELHDVLASWRYIRTGNLSVGEWMRSLRHVDVGGWFAADDPAPFLLLSLRMALRRSSRVLRLTGALSSDEDRPRFVRHRSPVRGHQS
jgi:D-aspartate ligase